MMEHVRERVVHAIKNKRLPVNILEFLEGWLDFQNNKFLLQESTHWDYKVKAPSNFKDEYYAGLVRLICAFHNTYGGVIIFGVDDKHKILHGNPGQLNIENLNDSLTQNLSETIECLYHEYTLPNDKNLVFLLVPKRSPGKPPVRLTRPLGKYKPGRIWRRIGHAVREPKATELPFLYTGRDDYGLESDTEQDLSIPSALPPSPATLQEFVGRRDAMDALWQWLTESNQPRLFLYGKGGSGKSTLAYEFARLVSETGARIRTSSNATLDYVLYLSAKEKELDTFGSQERPFNATDFTSSYEQFQQILLRSGWRRQGELNNATHDELLDDLEKLFDDSQGLIVIDDIDTLTTKGLDPGMEDLFTVAATATHKPKILYTLRNAPTWTRRNAVAVPGLDFETEYVDFLEACCRQFRVSVPDGTLISGRLNEVSGRIPLVLEVIAGLRRTTTDYNQAISLWEDKCGRDARQYLFQREYDALSDDRAKYVLAALALYDDVIDFDGLKTILRYSDEQLKSALNEVTEIFVEREDRTSERSGFKLAPVTKTFVLEATKQLTFFTKVQTYVDNFKRQKISHHPDVTNLKIRVEDFLADHCPSDALSEIERYKNDPSTYHHPQTIALSGRCWKELGGARLTDAREAFVAAFDQGLRDIAMMRDWFYLELTQVYNSTEAIKVCEKVTNSDDFNRTARSEFLSKKGRAFRDLARNAGKYDVDRTCNYYRDALLSYLAGAEMRLYETDRDASKSIEWAEDTFQEFVQYAFRVQNIDRVLDTIRDLTKESKRADIIAEGVVTLLEGINARKNKREAQRVWQKLQNLKAEIERNGSAVFGEEAKPAIISGLSQAQDRLEGGAV